MASYNRSACARSAFKLLFLQEDSLHFVTIRYWHCECVYDLIDLAIGTNHLPHLQFMMSDKQQGYT